MASNNADDRRRRRGDNRRGGRNGAPSGSKTQVNLKDVDESSPVIQMFLQFREELDSRHDKYERLVKLSRDVTIESKRSIFLLHRFTGSSKEAGATILKEAEEKLAEIRTEKFLPIAVELKDEDPYQFLRAVSPGLQEYIEAVSFFWYLKHRDLVTLQQLEADLVFEAPPPSTDAANTGPEAPDVDSPAAVRDAAATTSHPAASSEVMKKVKIVVPPAEYVLGIADLTGELMRMAINSVGAGDMDMPFQISLFIRLIYDAFVSFGNVSRELNRKMSVLRSSLQKVENACYTLKVRGSEIPKHMLADVLSMNPVSSAFPEEQGVDD